MSYQAKLMAVLDAYIAASMKTQTANEEFNSASELMDRAGANLDAAVAAEDVAFSALMQLRKDVLDGGYEEEAPAVEPESVEEEPVIESVKEVPAPEAIPEPVAEIAPEPVAEEVPAAVIEDQPAPVAVAEGEFLEPIRYA